MKDSLFQAISFQPSRCSHCLSAGARLKSIEMADTLYLSLWYPNLRLAGLAEKLTAVLEHVCEARWRSEGLFGDAWPVSWSETPVFQRVYGHGERGADPGWRWRMHWNCCTRTMLTNSRLDGRFGTILEPAGLRLHCARSDARWVRAAAAGARVVA